MEIGERVRVLKSPRYANKYKGYFGIVNKVYSYDMVGVKLDKKINECSSTGVFWFKENDVEIIEKESEDNFIMLEGYKVARVLFENETNLNRTYFYASYDDIDVDDIVVVHTGHHGLAIAKVVEIVERENAVVKYGREIVTKVDLTAYEERKEKVAKLAALKAEMNAKVKELQSMAIYEVLSEKDPALKSLLDEYKVLLR